MTCVFCKKENVEFWFGSFCHTCQSISDLVKVYGAERTLSILNLTCIRNPKQLEKKIEIAKQLKGCANN